MILRIRQELNSLISGRFKKESFSRNLSYVFAGKVIIIIFTFLTTPVLTRLYSPDAYAYFSFMNIIASNVAIIATLGFPAALVLVSNDREFYNLFLAVFITSFFFILLFSGLFIVFLDDILPFELGIHKWRYAAITIFGCLIYAWMQIFPKWNIFRNEFKTGAKINVLVNAGARLTSILVGFFFVGNSLGLIIGDLFGKMLGLTSNIFLNVKREWDSIFSHVSRVEMLAVVKKFKRYPHYILTAGYVAVLTTHIPLMIFPYVFEASYFGNYSLATGLIAIPGILLAHPLSSIFTKKIITLREEEPGKVPDFLKRVLYGLFISGVFPFAAVIVFGPRIFSFVFGAEWVFAGTVSSILAIYGLFEMLQISVQSILQVFKMENLIFSYNLIQLILVVLLILPGLNLADPILVVWGFTIAKTFSAFLVLAKVMDVCGINYGIVFFRFILMFVSLLGILVGLKNSWTWEW